MAKQNMFERMVRALPKHKLEELASDRGKERPWTCDRKTLEIFVISKDSEELRQEIADLVQRGLLP
jgi:hypothetical protein